MSDFDVADVERLFLEERGGIGIRGHRIGAEDNLVWMRQVPGALRPFGQHDARGVYDNELGFDKGAEVKAHNAHHKIILIDGNKLVDLMYEYNVGIQVKSTYEVKHLDEDFFIEE